MRQNLFLPGWGIPPEAYNALWSRVCGQEEPHILDYGFFQPASQFSFSDTGSFLSGFSGEKVLLGGHSMGAMFSLKIAAQFPERIAALVLFAPFARFSSAAGYPGRDVFGIEAMRRQLASAPSAVLKSFYRAMFLPAKSSLSVPARINAPFLESGLAFLADCDVREELGKIVAPTLLLHGAHDAISPAPMSDFVALPLGPLAEKICLEDAGHALPFTHQEACAAFAASFLAKRMIPW
ncbi:MAG: hypothetical protein A2X49_05135 [Lentisphaerae bacterium GWF2_52_8]|nr:MAG: hypothetical protein A2X49_05135 [Lentisphaerae bacterium GWF2_52_8]